MNEGVSVRGWEIFFVEIDRFIQVSERHLESANDRYTDYVLERLAILYQSISTIKERLESELSSEEQLSLSAMLDCLGDLLTLLPQLANKWQEHSNNIEIRHLSSRYQVPDRSLHTVVVHTMNEGSFCKRLGNFFCGDR